MCNLKAHGINNYSSIHHILNPEKYRQFLFALLNFADLHLSCLSSIHTPWLLKIWLETQWSHLSCQIHLLLLTLSTASTPTNTESNKINSARRVSLDCRQLWDKKSHIRDPIHLFIPTKTYTSLPTFIHILLWESQRRKRKMCMHLCACECLSVFIQPQYKSLMIQHNTVSGTASIKGREPKQR